MHKFFLASLFCLFFSIAAKAQQDNVSQEKVYISVQEEPSFPGGFKAFSKFLSKNIVYPNAAREKHTQGKVLVSFIVEKDGKLTDVKVARGIGDGCDEEAVRVIKLSSPWKPGSQNNHALRVAYTVPVNFALPNK